ncbi:hypothetical protein J3A83DRAFT_4187756 [Scleroderma citrinum]
MSTSILAPHDAAHRGMPHDQKYYPSQPVFDPPVHRSPRSDHGNLYVLSYTPAHGDEGTLIRATFTCKGDIGFDVRIRLVIGALRVTTNVDELEQTGSESWQLDASVPSFDRVRWSSRTVPLTIEAIDKDNQVLDWVRFGDFTYGDAMLKESLTRRDLSTPTHSPSSYSRPPASSLRLVTGLGSPDRSSKRKSPNSIPPTPISDSEYASSSSSQTRSRRSPGRPHVLPNIPGLRRTRQVLEQSEQNPQSALLEILTPLDNFCYHWDESELQAGRRLVRFRRFQDRNNLMISAEHISQAEYDPNDIVVSCIYREETDSFCITSVDIIHLLQRLVDAEFEVDEKNRIRRNLEGLRPTTVSKTRPGFESFFQRIMDFPDPKPRKIEKDLKVFDWKLLPQALEKIISKYSIYTASSPASPRSREDGFGTLQHDASNGLQEVDQVAPKDEPLEYFQSYSDGGAFPPAPTCHDTQLEVSQLSHLSPVTQLSVFPAAEPGHLEPSQAQNSHLCPLPEETFLPVVLKGYLNGDMVYDIHSTPHDACGMDPSASMNHHSSFGQTEQAHDWVVPLQPHNLYHQSHPDEDLMPAFTITATPAVGSGTTQEHGHNYANTRGHAASTPPHPLIYGHAQVQLYSASQSQMHTSDYGFDSNEMLGLYAPINYATNSYDAFELQPAPREHNIDANTNSGINDCMNNGMNMNATTLAGQVAF